MILGTYLSLTSKFKFLKKIVDFWFFIEYNNFIVKIKKGRKMNKTKPNAVTLGTVHTHTHTHTQVVLEVI